MVSGAGSPDADDNPSTDIPSIDHVGAVILAGGLARRMEGRDKGLIELSGKPMVQWVLEKLRPQAGSVVINANRNQQRYAAFGVPVIADALEGHLGPLAGLAAALGELDTDYVFMCPCDSPFIPADMISKLFQSLVSAGATIAVARDADRVQPVFLLVHRRCEPSLQEFLSSGQRKIDRWFLQLDVVQTDFSDYPEAFRNINTEEERQSAEELIG